MLQCTMERCQRNVISERQEDIVRDSSFLQLHNEPPVVHINTKTERMTSATN